MKRILVAAVLLISLTSLKSANQVDNTDEPILTKVTFSTHTNNDNKDHDTGVYVKVFTSDGSGLIAHADNRDNSGSDATEYNDGSDHSFTLDTDADVMKKSDCKGFKVVVSQQTNGNDTWKFNAVVTLRFSSGTPLTASRDGIELKNSGASAEFQSPN